MFHLLLLLLRLLGASGQDCYFSQSLPEGRTLFVESPPQGYPPGSGGCTWDASTSPWLRIRLNCSTVDLPQPCVDRLVVTPDGGSFCKEFVFTSRADYLRLSLITGRRTPGGRFSCSVTAVRPDAERPCECGQSYKLRIVGGVATGINEFPMMSAIVSSLSRGLVCGSVIISRRAALTAAHCLRSRPSASTLALLVGEHDVSTGRDTDATRLIAVRSYSLHPAFDPSTLANDVALLKTGEIPFSLRVGPACLPFNVAAVAPGESVTILGWGTKELGGELSNTLQKISVKVMPGKSCSQAYGPKYRPQGQICTYSPGKDACQFDSGGPVLGQDPSSGRYFLLGLVSYGRGCADTVPAVNTAVFPFLDWITREASDENFCRKQFRA